MSSLDGEQSAVRARSDDESPRRNVSAGHRVAVEDERAVSRVDQPSSSPAIAGGFMGGDTAESDGHDGARTSTWARLRSGLLGRGAISLLVATAGVNVSNFLFHVVVSRLLGPSNYGIIGAILSIISLLAIPLGAAQLAITQAVVDDVARHREFHLSRVLRSSVMWGVIGFALFAALVPFIDGFLHTESPVPLLLVSLWIPLATVGAVLQGALIGEYRYRAVGFATFFGGGPVRLALGAVAAVLGFGVVGAIVATVVGQAFITGSLLVSARSRLRTSPNSALRAKRGDVALSVAALTGYTALIGIDTFLARHFLSPSAAGHYAAGALAAHIALFVPGAIVMVAFPHLAAGKGLDSKSRRVFIEAIVAITTLSVVVATGMSLFSGLTIRILFGQSYLSSVPLIAPLAFTSVGFGLTSTLIYFQLARRSKWALTPWLGVLSAGALISLVHSSTVSIATSMLVVSWVTTLVTAVPVIQAYLAVSASDAAGELKWFDLPAQELDLTVVIPFFNPGPRLAQHVRDVTRMLEESGLSFEILAVSDGSTDRSEETLASQTSDKLRLICLSKNQGKGAALRVGLAEGRGEYLGFIDGDGDIPPASLRNLLDVIGGQRPDVIFGSKRHPDSDVIYPMLRRIYSWGYQQLNHLLFRLPVRDTQTGVKVVRRDVLAEVLPRMVEKRFAFDLELFVVARQLGYTHFVEVPVSIRERFTSTVSWRSVRATLIDTAAIFYRLRLLHFYSRDRGIARRSDYGDDRGTAPIRGGVGTANLSVDTRTRHGSLRILVLNWRDLAHPKAGGAEIYTHRVAEEWVKAGHDVTLFCAAVEGRPGLDSLNGVRIIRRGSWLSVYSEARNFYLGEGRGSFDLVVDEVNTRPFGASKWVDDAPVIGLVHQVCRELWFYQTPFPFAVIGRYILEPLWLRSLRDVPVVTVSESSRASLQIYGLRDVSVVPEGRDADYPTLSAHRETSPTVVFVGRLEAHKRPDDAIRAFRNLRDEMLDAQMWVIGSGPMEEELRRLAPVGVEFLGRLTQEEKLRRMARAHVLLVTSVREGWGLVVTEAASVGTPTIAYDVDGLRDSVWASNGVLVPPNPEDLSSTLREYLANWMNHGLPPVRPGGVINWRNVALGILDKSMAAFETSKA